MAKIEIDLADLGLPTGFDYEDGEPTGSLSLSDLIISAAVEKLLAANRNIVKEIREQVNNAITKEIDTNVRTYVQEAFDAPIQRTTSWGEAQGEPTTVRELIRTSIESYVKAPSSDKRGYNDRPKNLVELIDDSTKQMLDKDFTEYLKQVKEGVKVTVHQKALDAAVQYLQK